MESVDSSVTASRTGTDKQKAEVDIISKLPDSLISHILSCLPTKDAVRTSVLSKRWIDCWTLINKVNIDECDGELYYSRMTKASSGKLCQIKTMKSTANQHFINFVYKSLFIRKVESFSLFITSNYDETLISAWISCILNQRPKKIHICTNSELNFSAHTSQYLFNHAYNLEELVLKMCCCAIKVPSSRVGDFSFGNLKVLKLRGIIFTIDKSLVIRLSVLKKFETKNCCWLSAHDVTIEAPLLESVLIEQDRESVFRKPRSCQIKFSASCIKEFTYRSLGGISQPIVLSNSSAARNASVNIILNKDGCESYVQETESCAFILLKQFREVKCIKFDASEVKIISLDLLKYLILYRICWCQTLNIYFIVR
jgi:hypothetical protein